MDGELTLLAANLMPSGIAVAATFSHGECARAYYAAPSSTAGIRPNEDSDA